MRLTDYLKPLAIEDWQSATKHMLTDALVNGSLPTEKMLRYLRKDYLFLDGFVRLLASAIAQAPTLPDAIPAAQFLGMIPSPENTYYLRSIEVLGRQITPMAQPADVTLGFSR
jgi:thiaminase (transcriptional activator TenA)